MRTFVEPGDGQDAAEAPDLSDGEVVEVVLFLIARQLAAFEAVAHQRGLTAGQMLRRLIGGFLRQAEQQGSDR